MFINFFTRLITSVRRRSLYKEINYYGKNFSCDPSTRILRAKDFRAGDNVFIGEQSYISAKIEISDNFMCGPRVVILGGNHHFAVSGRRTRFLKQDPEAPIDPIVIMDDVWIGACSTVIGPLVIGMGAIIGANSVVIKTVPPYTVNVGSPAVPIKLIFSDEDLFANLLYFGLDEAFIESVINTRREQTKGLDLEIINRTDDYWENNVSK